MLSDCSEKKNSNITNPSCANMCENPQHSWHDFSQYHFKQRGEFSHHFERHHRFATLNSMYSIYAIKMWKMISLCLRARASLSSSSSSVRIIIGGRILASSISHIDKKLVMSDRVNTVYYWARVMHLFGKGCGIPEELWLLADPIDCWTTMGKRDIDTCFLNGFGCPA